MVRVQQLSELEEVCLDIIWKFTLLIYLNNHYINHIMGKNICSSNRSLITVHFLLETLLLKDDGPLFAICGMNAYRE